MKHTSRILVAAALVLFGTSALPFEDGFEAQASTCWSGVEKVDALNDTQGAVLVSHGSMVCLDGATAKFDCQPDALGICKRETPPVPPDPPQPARTRADAVTAAAARANLAQRAGCAVRRTFISFDGRLRVQIESDLSKRLRETFVSK